MVLDLGGAHVGDFLSKWLPSYNVISMGAFEIFWRKFVSDLINKSPTYEGNFGTAQGTPGLLNIG